MNLTLTAPFGGSISSSIAMILGITDSTSLARHIRKALMIGMVKDRQKWLKRHFLVVDPIVRILILSSREDA